MKTKRILIRIAAVFAAGVVFASCDEQEPKEAYYSDPLMIGEAGGTVTGLDGEYVALTNQPNVFRRVSTPPASYPPDWESTWINCPVLREPLRWIEPRLKL